MYTIRNILPAGEKELFKGLYIIILHPFRIPPHLLLSYGGKVFSITVHGPRPNENLESLLRVFSTRSLPLLFCKVKLPKTTEKNVFDCLESVVQEYQRVEVGGATCLSPLKSFFRQLYALDVNTVNFIFELIPLLEYNELIEGYGSVQMQDAEFTFTTYNQEDIDREIIKALGTGLPSQMV